MKRYMANNAHYLPVKIHIKEQPKVFQPCGVQWMPTIQVLHHDGTKRHQFEGYSIRGLSGAGGFSGATATWLGAFGVCAAAMERGEDRVH
jgi:hypothetical protein